MLFGQAISGVVFLDVNANGQKDATEVGLAGTSVTAFNAAGASFGPFNSAATTGAWTSTALAAGQYRLEFTLPTGFFATPKGATSNTTVQFAAAGATNANLGILYPTDYCQNPVNLAVPCYEAGGAAPAWTDAATHPAVAAFPSTAAPTTSPAVTKNVGYGNIGSTWGAAYKKDAKRMFFSNVFKRHSDLGEFARPSGGSQTADGIYMLDYANNGLASVYKGGFRLQGVAGIDLGSVARGYKSTAISAASAADDNLLSTVNRQNRDLAAFSKVGKIGLGDIHISEDLKTLYAVNLNQRNLIKIDVSNPAGLPTTGGTISASLVSTVSIDYSVCGTVVGTLRPWAISLWHGRGYVGVVNDAMGGTAANLKAFVLSFDPATGGGWVKEFEMSLDFNRENSAWPTSQNTALRSGKWRPWVDTWAFPTLSEEFSYPQPILANLEFTPNGSMVLGFLDRAGLQFDYNELSPITGNTKLLSVDAAGDVVYVCKSSGSFIVEGDVNCLIDTDPGTPSTANDGPKNMGEFFYQDYALNGAAAHYEESFGALAMLLGSQQVVTSGFDVVTEVFNQGIDFYSTVTGKQTSSYQITPNNVNKGVGLGEPEPLCAVAPIQIGNFVWKDTDGDGLQDAGEPALAGVTVKLLAADGITILGTAVTDANGQYFFSNQTGTSTASNIVGLVLLTNTNYFLKIMSLGTSPTVAGLSLTNPTTGGSTALNSGNSLANNDAALAGGMPTIALKTGGFGENNHTYDVGFIACSLTATASANPTAVCVGQTVNLMSSGGAGGATYAWTGPAGFASTAQNPSISGISSAKAGTYSVTITDFPGCTSTASATFSVNSVTATASNTAGCQGEAILLSATGPSGATYAWSGPDGFTSTAQNPSILISQAENAGVYAVVVTKDGCSASANTTVELSTSGPIISCNSPICAGQKLNLSTSAGTSYSWAGPGGVTFSSNSIQNPMVSGLSAGSYSISVTVTGGGCAGNKTKNITVNANPIASATAPIVCEGDQILLHATGGTTYAWSGPNGWSSTSSDPIINPALTDEHSGTYSVTITNPASFCAATVDVTVLGGPQMLTNYAEIISADNTVTNATLANNSTTEDDDATVMTELQNCTLPTATVAATSATCNGATANPNGSVLISSILNGDKIAYSLGATYSGVKYLAATVVSGSSHTISGLPNPSVPTVYTVRVFNASQCCSRDYQVTLLPTPCAAAASNSPICAGGILELTASGGDSYSWSGPSGWTSTVQNPTRTPALAGTYSVTATIGAATSVASTVVVVNAPTATAAANSPVPVGQSINFTATGGGTYAWTGPNSFVSTDQNPKITAAVLANSGNYTVVVTDVTGCTASATVAVSVITPPSSCSMTLAASSDAPICEASTLHLMATPGSAATSFSWTGPSNFSSNLQNPSIEGVTPNHQNGTFSVTATDAVGCTAVATVAVTIDSMPPDPTISGLLCVAIGDTVSLSAAGPATGNYTWTLPNATTISGKNVLVTPATLAAHNGVWTVALTNGTCSATAFATVVIKPQTHLVLEKVADKTTITAGSNETVIFTIKLTNQGSSPATDVLVKDKLPSGFSFVSSSPSAGTYDPVSGIWTIPSAPTGASTLTITATVQ